MEVSIIICHKTNMETKLKRAQNLVSTQYENAVSVVENLLL